MSLPLCCTSLMQNENSCSPDLVDHGQISLLVHFASLFWDRHPVFHQRAFHFSFKEMQLAEKALFGLNSAID